MKLYLAVFILLLLVPISTAEELEIQPHVLDTYFISTDDNQDATYKFTANRLISNCVSVEGACRIDNGHVVYVDYEFDKDTKSINDVITITDNEGNTAAVDVSIKVIDIGDLVNPGICLFVVLIGLVLFKSKSKDGK